MATQGIGRLVGIEAVGLRRRRVLAGGLLLALGLAGGVGGCQRDTRLAGRKLHGAQVRTVTHYGITLDQQASPQQVAFVALRAIRDDVLAENQAARDAALERQFDVCAGHRILESNVRRLRPEEHLYDVVSHWAPTVAHYARGFETDWDKAQVRLVLRQPPDPGKPESARCAVLMEVTDATGGPTASAVLVVHLAKDDGYWRVTHLGFERGRRTIAAAAAGAAIPAPGLPEPGGTVPGGSGASGRP